MSKNYFNSLTLREQLEQLGKCRFMDPEEFSAGVEPLKNKKLVIVGCGAQGLNQGLNLRDSGLDVESRKYKLHIQHLCLKRKVAYYHQLVHGMADAFLFFCLCLCFCLLIGTSVGFRLFSGRY